MAESLRVTDRRAGHVADLLDLAGAPVGIGELPAAFEAAIDVRAELRMVVWAWHHDATIADATLERFGVLAARFMQRLGVSGCASLLEVTDTDCEAFVWAVTRRGNPPATATVHLRRSALRAVFRTVSDLAGRPVGPAEGLVLPAKGPRTTRPLTAQELQRVRTAALARRDPTVSLMVALAEATATTSETPQVMWADVDLSAGLVRLPGASPVVARHVPLTDWARGVLTNVTPIDPASPVVSTRVAGHGAQASVANRLARLLAAAGVHGPGIKPHSIRLWAGRQHLERHGIEAAARALGLASLDVTADALAHDWRTP